MDDLGQIYTSICDGFSERDGLRLIHSSFLENQKLKGEYDRALAWAVANGLKKDSEIIDSLIQSGGWSYSKEMYISDLRKKITGLEQRKPHIKSFDQIDYIYDELVRMRDELGKVNSERYGLLKDSAERFAENKERFVAMARLVYKESEPGIWKPVGEPHLDYSNYIEYLRIEAFYYEEMYKLSNENVKKICVEPFFYIIFNLSDKSFDFFQKPLVNLTSQQVSLLRLGETFAKIAAETPDLPEEYEKNPDKMLMYWYAVRNGAAEKAKEQANTGNKMKELFNSLQAAGR